MNLQLPHLIRRGLGGAILAAALAAGCSEANVRTDTPLPLAQVDRSNGATDTAFFVSGGIAKPYKVYGESSEKYKNDRVVPGATLLAAAPVKAAARADASSVDQPPMTMKAMAAVIPPAPPVVFGGVAAYQPIIGTIPVGNLMDVQAWVSSDLRYVNMNLHYTRAGPVTFTPVPLVPFGAFGP